MKYFLIVDLESVGKTIKFPKLCKTREWGFVQLRFYNGFASEKLFLRWQSNMERLFYRDLASRTLEYCNIPPVVCPYCQSKLLSGFDNYEWRSHIIELRYTCCSVCGWWHVDYFDCDTDHPYGNDEHSDYFQSILCNLYTDDDIGMCCRELFKDVALNPQILYSASPRQVEGIVGGCFRGVLNCSVELTKTTRDGGRDLVGLQSDRGPFIVEVKKYNQSRKVGISIIRDFLGAMVIDNVQRGFIVTTSNFSSDSILLQDRLRKNQKIEIELKDIEDINSWLQLSFDKYFNLELIKSTICNMLCDSAYVSFPLDGFPLVHI